MKFDFRKIQQYFSPKSMKDVDTFLREMPMRAGQLVLIAGGVIWLLAGVAFVYGNVRATELAELSAELYKENALKPTVPRIVDQPVNQKQLDEFVKVASAQYENVTITSGPSELKITANDGRFFGVFREAVGHAFNAGVGWRLSVKQMCVGRECTGPFLSGTFDIKKKSVER